MAKRRAGVGRAAALCLIVAACAARPDSAVLDPVAIAAPGATSAQIFVATSRARAEPGRNVFTAGRAQALNFAAFTISVPPTHAASNIEWPTTTPADPRTAFATTGQSVLDSGSFYAAIDRAAAAAGGEVVVFVHGYNTNFEEALFRFAQVQHDVGRRGVPVLFAWPSTAEVTGYVADRESATFSRDYLERLLADLGRQPNVRTVLLAAHSMGSWLAVEALRQARIRGGGGLAKLGDVMLAAPDIDVEVFATQLQAIGRLKRPITVLTAKDDRALAFSRRIGGDVERVGAASADDPRVGEAARRFGVRVIDISAMPSDTPLNHNKYVTSVPVLAQLAASGWRRESSLSDVGAFVLDAAGRVIQAR
jgi:esterase/lipase superfamily enzyme